MAQELILDTGGTATIPGGYAQWSTGSSGSGLATNGIIALVGEADAGPDYSSEADLDLNVYGPNSLSDVIAKYKSGPLVDAYRVSLQPMNDPEIPGSPGGFILVKTNVSTKASAALPKVGGGTYGTLADRSYGTLGNMIYFTTSAKVAEVKPTTGAFTFLPPIASLNMSVRVNGGAAVAYTAAAGQLPSAFVSGLGGADTDLTVSGGTNRSILAAISGDLAVAVVGNVATFTYTGTWGTTPTAGDTLYVPTGSAIEGAASANCGSYVVTAATTTTITATKLMDASGSPGALTAPVAVSSTPVVATTDLEAFAPVTITLSGTSVLDGTGKSLEIAELTTGTDRLSNCCYALSTTKVSWISKTGTPAILQSAAEQVISLNTNRQADNVTENITAGGNIGLRIGYAGTTATCTIALVNGVTTLTTTVVGGSGTNLNLILSSFPTIADLAAYISAQAGYTAKAATAAVGQISPLALDENTFGICGTFYTTPGAIKYDAYDFFTAVSTGSVLVQLGDPDPTQALAGLPDVNATATYLAGGARGGTTQAAFQAAVDALEAVDCNFVVPCVSRDATADIADGLTDSSSSYLIDSVNDYVRQHCLKMSTLKRRKNRQFLPSKRDTYVNVKTAAAELAGFRSLMSFQDLKDLGANGIQQFHPYITAAKAAAAQAAGFYKAIFHKTINATGAVQAAGDWNPKNQDNVEDALKSGLAPIVYDKRNGWHWASDQNTYLKDSNTILNSFQAVYAADVVSMSAAEFMEDSFTGKPFVNLNEGQVLSKFAEFMEQMCQDKLVTKTAKMPLGYQNATVKIGAGSIIVNCEATLTTACYFAVVNFLFNEATN